eukprot:NODE_151_length_15465_cov_0.405376.p10 type:complete len:111 gc:universal NODE_151_length_15465_cov_0.405376:5309-4977(-)
MPYYEMDIFSHIDNEANKAYPHDWNKFKIWFQQFCKYAIIQILNALTYIHSIGYAHLDVKFENVFINHDEMVLADWEFLNLYKSGKNEYPIIYKMGTVTYIFLLSIRFID